MTVNSKPWLETVVRHLQESKGRWRVIAAETRIPYNTLTKIALGRVGDPRVSNVQALFDYFAAHPNATDSDAQRNVH